MRFTSETSRPKLFRPASSASQASSVSGPESINVIGSRRIAWTFTGPTGKGVGRERVSMNREEGKAALGPEVVRIPARLVHAIADRRAVGVTVPVEGLEVRDHAMPGVVAEPARDLDLAGR